MIKKEVIIIGGGPAGMAAALKLNEMGFRDIVILEKEAALGGVLRQCIHPGFGLTKLGKNLTGPEYGYYYAQKVKEADIEVVYNATVLEVKGANPVSVMVQQEDGKQSMEADAVILASGCRETSRGALQIPGSRPAGIYTAGTAQAMMNLHNVSVGKKIVIVGSGDIGLIMARRFTLEGSEVVCVVEREAVCGGLERNQKECLEDFGIPLLTGAQVCEIKGKKRADSVVVSDRFGKKTEIFCDTIILSAGLIPEERMVKERSEGIFFCGNALFVHDLVDDVSECGESVAIDVAGYLLTKDKKFQQQSDYSGENIAYARKERKAFVNNRRKEKEELSGERFIICTMCPNGCRISLNGFTGGKCNKGEIYARSEIENPKRTLTTSVRIAGTDDIVSVRTDRSIPGNRMMEAMNLVKNLEVSPPVKIGDIIREDFIEAGCNLIATRNYI